jgi:hypothetical protein
MLRHLRSASVPNAIGLTTPANSTTTASSTTTTPPTSTTPADGSTIAIQTGVATIIGEAEPLSPTLLALTHGDIGLIDPHSPKFASLHRGNAMHLKTPVAR